MPHKLFKILARSAERFGGHFRKTHGGDGITPPPLHGRGLKRHVASLKGKKITVVLTLQGAFCNIIEQIAKGGISERLRLRSAYAHIIRYGLESYHKPPDRTLTDFREKTA